MRIADVRTHVLTAPLERPMADALHYIDRRTAILVVVETDDGLTGVGEAAGFGGPPVSTTTVIHEEMAPHIIGEDACDIGRLWRRMYQRSMQHGRHGIVMCAMSGIDIALWDLLGKATGQPTYKLLGGERNRLRAYASTGFYQAGQSPEDVGNELLAAIGEQFGAVKMKVGRNPVEHNPLGLTAEPDFCSVSLSDDVDRVAAAREAVGPDVSLMLDANTAWVAHTALGMMRRLETFDPYWIEEPVAPHDLAGSARLAASTPVPVAGYETVQGAYAFRQLLEARAVGIAQPDATWSGGLSELQHIASLAYAHNVPVAPHAFSSIVSLMANLHFAAAAPTATLMEIDRTPNPLRERLAGSPPAIEDGHVAPFDTPGLGIELDWDVVREFEASAQVSRLTPADAREGDDAA